jgi:hypothetical protein
MSSSYIDPEYEYHEFYLDSKDASNSISTGISSLNWPIFNLATPLKEVVSFKILEAQIPLSYSVTTGASFVINYYPQYTAGNTISTPVSKTVTLPQTGTLSGAQIATYISTQLLNFPVNTPGWEKGGTDTYLVCTFITSSTSPTGLPYFKFEPNDHATTSGTLVQEAYEIIVSNQRTQDLMGFPIGTTQCDYFGYSPAMLIAAGEAGTYKKPLTSPRPTLITGAPYIYVTSNTIGNLCKTYLPLGASLLGGGVSSPQLAKIPVSNVVQGQWLVWQDSNPAWFDVDVIANLSQMDMFIQLGNYGGFIDFQGLSFSLKLGVLVKRSTRVHNNGRGTFIQSSPFFLNSK